MDLSWQTYDTFDDFSEWEEIMETERIDINGSGFSMLSFFQHRGE